MCLDVARYRHRLGGTYLRALHRRDLHLDLKLPLQQFLPASQREVLLKLPQTQEL